MDARWGWFSFRNRLKFRWTGDLHNYNLEIKTVRNWGVNKHTKEHYQIKYNIIKLA